MAATDRLFIGALSLVPKKPLSRVVRRLSWVHSPVAVRAFANRYRIEVDEAEKPIDAYPSVADFFTRRLKPGARPLDPDPDVLLCPSDGAIGACGTIEGGRLIQAKGREYTLATLLADDELARRYDGGSFATFYLSPRDYHRVHSPATGRIAGCTYVPGRLYPVNRPAVRQVDELFARNERLITHLMTDRFGAVQVVMVGATFVGHIRLCYDATLVTNDGGREIERRSYEPNLELKRGEELGVFEFGSTVVLILEPGVELDSLELDRPTRVGERFAVRRSE